jgi:DtxR family Mn-dependent transcriptional regulator
MARKLATKKLVNYTKYKPLTLTDSGNRLALNVIRKHRLWEAFLHHTLKLSLHEVHREAEYLEHLTSDFLADKMDEFLGRPAVDPHGDPIPSASGEMENDSSHILLSEAKAGQEYLVTRLFSTEKEFFEFCSANYISVGTRLKVEKQYMKNKITEIKLKESKILLNEEFGNIIFVKGN